MKDGHKLLHYKALQRFQQKFYDGVLTIENLDEEEKHFDKWKNVTINEKERGVNFAGYEFDTGTKKYLVQSFDDEETGYGEQRTDIKDILPIRVDETVPRGIKNTMYEVVKEYTPVRHKPEKTMTFKELVNSLATFHHTQKKQYRLYWMIVLACYFSRCYARISTAPGFGKDSAVKVLDLLKGKANSVNAEVSRAKLEFFTNQKLLSITEFADLTPDEWSNVEQFLLDVADDSPDIPKRSRAYQGVGEILDISDFSMLLFFNDKDCYQDEGGYFDDRAKEAVDNRFPALRFGGTIDDKRLLDIEKVDVDKLVEENEETYRKLLRAITYWEENFESEQNQDWMPEFDESYPMRWQKNLQVMAKAINLYAESEDEYSRYVNILKRRIDEYDKMLDYIPIYEATIDGMDDSAVDAVDEKVDAQTSYDSKIRVLTGIQKNGISGNGYKGLDDF